MSSVTKKREDGRRAVYPVAIIIVTCPKCGACPGSKCLETWSGHTFERAQPHKPRIDDSKPKI